MTLLFIAAIVIIGLYFGFKIAGAVDQILHLYWNRYQNKVLIREAASWKPERRG